MNVDFLQAIKLFFSKGFTFSGRSTRAEYWYAILFILIVTIILNVFGSVGNIINSVFSLVCLVPILSLVTRRFHDTGRSGWWTIGYYVLNFAIGFWILNSGGKELLSLIEENPDSLDIMELIPLFKKMAIPSLCSMLLSILFLILMCLPSGPDNVYGPDPYKDFGAGVRD